MLKRNSLFLMLPVLLVTFLGGCALSPQNVTIAPDIEIKGNQVALDGPVTVTVYDQRLSPWLGSRGGVYSGSNKIGIENNLQDAVRSSVEKALQKAGMQPGHSAAAPQFQVYIDTLEYHVPDSSYVSHVDLKAAVRVVVQVGTARYQGSYIAEDDRRVFRAPSDEENEEMINGILAKAVERAFDDPGLLRFMARL